MVAHIVRAEDEMNLLSQIVFNEITQLPRVFPACQTVNQQNFITPNQGRRVRLVSFADKHINILFQLFFTQQGTPLFLQRLSYGWIATENTEKPLIPSVPCGALCGRQSSSI